MTWGSLASLKSVVNIATPGKGLGQFALTINNQPLTMGGQTLTLGATHV